MPKWDAPAQFGIASNGIYLQLFQRHGKIVVPRTPVYKLQQKSIDEIIQEIKTQIDNPRRALTTMFWNNKGGVGKTTITAHIGAALSTKPDTNVLIINFDLQGDINELFGIAPMTRYSNEHGITMYDALQDVGKGLNEINYNNLIVRVSDNLDLIPGDLSMFEVEAGDFTNREKSLKLLLETGLYDDYDYIFIDASPSWRGIGELAACCSDIIIPIIDGNFSFVAIERIKNLFLIPEDQGGKWVLENSENPPKIHGYIINRHQKRNLSLTIDEWLYDLCRDNPIAEINKKEIIGTLGRNHNINNIRKIRIKRYVDFRNNYDNDQAGSSSVYWQFIVLSTSIF